MKGFVMQIPTNGMSPQMTEQEFADLNRKMAKRAMCNMLILFGIKWAIIIGINRWARSLDEKN